MDYDPKIYFMEEHKMFSKESITYTCQTTNAEKLRDYMVYACEHGYAFDYERKYTAGAYYYEITIGLSRQQADFMAVMALGDQALKFHDNRNKERKAEYEDARRDGYSQAVEDMAHKAHDRKG